MDEVMRLLWRADGEPARRGPRPGQSVDTVVAAGIALADADGLDAVTMRRVAERLGVAPMTLYTYVPGKAELLELMLDGVYTAMARADTAGRPWRERAEALAAENKALYDAHPWAALISMNRPPLGPGVMAKYEHELAAFDGLGLDDVTVDAALTHLLNFVRSVARDAADARTVRRETAMTDARWWAANGPLLERVLDPADYPRAVRVGAAAGAAQNAAYDPQRAYAFGLPRVLDGLAALIS
jgi:AcrR family transcriptional regulator